MIYSTGIIFVTLRSMSNIGNFLIQLILLVDIKGRKVHGKTGRRMILIE